LWSSVVEHLFSADVCVTFHQSWDQELSRAVHHHGVGRTRLRAAQCRRNADDAAATNHHRLVREDRAFVDLNDVDVAQHQLSARIIRDSR
jgi:hypothetical protein